MAPKSRKNPYESQDRYLIAEQPGMAVLVTGLLIALFIGLIARAYIAPARVRGLIEKAAQNINKDISVQFDSAEVSLSDGILPRFAVVISNVRMSSSQECWMAPTLEIDQMRLPVSLWGLFTGQGVVREIQTDDVTLTLHGSYRDCLRKKALPGTASETTAAAPAKAVRLQAEPAAAEKKGNRIRDISIGRLQIEFDKYPSYHAEFHDIDFRVKNFESQWLILNAKTHLFRDEQVGDYLAHANIHVEYKALPEPGVQAHFFGNWREGHYSFVGNYSPSDKNLILETEIKHIPLSQIIGLMQRYRLVEPTLNARQLWLSFNSRYVGELNKISQSPVEVSHLQLDGDQIEMDADKINLKSLQPLSYEPIRLNIQKLNVDKVLSFYNRTLPTHFFSHLGSFSGRADIHSPRDVRLAGNYSGLEFIFSNKGQRELQVIDSMATEATYSGDAWKIQLSRIEPRQGRFDGNIDVLADKSFSDMNVKLRVEQALLSPQVQNLMTQGGEIGPVKTHLDLHLREGHVIGMKGQLKTGRVKIEGAEANAAKASFDYENKDVIMNLQLESLLLGTPSTALQVVGPVFTPLSEGRAIEVRKISGQFRTQEFKTLSWRNFTGQLVNNNSRISTEGGWDEEARLSGQITVKGHKGQRKWKIEGTRGLPRFEPLTAEPRR